MSISASTEKTPYIPYKCPNGSGECLELVTDHTAAIDTNESRWGFRVEALATSLATISNGDTFTILGVTFEVGTEPCQVPLAGIPSDTLADMTAAANILTDALMASGVIGGCFKLTPSVGSPPLKALVLGEALDAGALSVNQNHDLTVLNGTSGPSSINPSRGTALTVAEGYKPIVRIYKCDAMGNRAGKAIHTARPKMELSAAGELLATVSINSLINTSEPTPPDANVDAWATYAEGSGAQFQPKKGGADCYQMWQGYTLGDECDGGSSIILPTRFNLKLWPMSGDIPFSVYCPLAWPTVTGTFPTLPLITDIPQADSADALTDCALELCSEDRLDICFFSGALVSFATGEPAGLGAWSGLSPLNGVLATEYIFEMPDGSTVTDYIIHPTPTTAAEVPDFIGIPAGPLQVDSISALTSGARCWTVRITQVVKDSVGGYIVTRPMSKMFKVCRVCCADNIHTVRFHNKRTGGWETVLAREVESSEKITGVEVCRRGECGPTLHTVGTRHTSEYTAEFCAVGDKWAGIRRAFLKSDTRFVRSSGVRRGTCYTVAGINGGGESPLVFRTKSIRSYDGDRRRDETLIFTFAMGDDKTLF